jgi:membrane protease YdiL (CAAX protease family)
VVGPGAEVTDRRAGRPAGPLTGADVAPRWGLGDAFVGFLAAQALSLVVGAIVLDVLAGRGMAVGAELAAIFDGHGRGVSAGLTLTGLALIQVPLWATELGTVWWAGEVRGAGVRHDFGLGIRVADVAVGLAAGVAAQAVVSGAYAIVDHVVNRADSDRAAREIAAKAHGTGVIALLLLFAVIAPFVEELFYRGLVLRSLEHRMPRGWALVVSAAIFAFVHLEPLLFPGLFVAGLVFAWLAQRTGRLGPAIFAHIGFNASTIVVMALAR